MADVLPLSRIAEPAAPEAALYRRIRLASGGLVALFTTVAAGYGVLAAILILAMFLDPVGILRIGPSGTYIVTSGAAPADTIRIIALPLWRRLFFVPVALAAVAPSLAILLSLRRLFGLYARGIVFAPQNALQIRLIGLWLVIGALTPFVLHVVQSALGIEIDRAWLHMNSLQELVLGALVFVIAEVMRVGHEIEQERGAFI